MKVIIMVKLGTKCWKFQTLPAEESDINLTNNEMQQTINRLENGKTPGPDDLKMR